MPKVSIEISAWISNYIHIKLWDEITQPCLYFNGSLAKLPLKLGMDKSLQLAPAITWANGD